MVCLAAGEPRTSSHEPVRGTFENGTFENQIKKARRKNI